MVQCKANGNPAFLSAYLGSKEDLYTIPDKNLTLLKPEYVEQHKNTTIKGWFNDQINYTKDLKTEDIRAYAKHICGADNMTFIASGNMPKEEFLHLVQKSALTQIPQAQKYNPFENLTDKQAHQNLSYQMDIDDYKVSSFEVTYPSRNPEEAKIAKEFFKLKMCKGLQKEEPHAYIADFTTKGISAQITTQKEKLMQDKLVSLMAASVKDFSLSATEMQTLQSRLKMDNLSAETIQDVATQAFQNAKLSVNGSKPKSISNLAYLQGVKNKNILHIQQNTQAPLKPKQISVDIAKLKYCKQQSSR